MSLVKNNVLFKNENNEVHDFNFKVDTVLSF